MEPITRANTTTERVYLDALGYDSRGRYFGTGQPLYRLDAADLNTAIVNKYGHECNPIYLRADGMRQARLEANADGFAIVRSDS